ncbi:MAG: rod-binding protein [Phenylobacterium sp.]|jgi:Rod binding domain-containing protein|uniref:rod-binding protein n=1 Tax=Phenylobacterium sp. TaxID=1871053 RepID=UPI002A35AEE2|nr:rod-binding protein [Phenylobacterium sp.]MDX9997128.1 rod-binding protein [Phenylobacterium sp.]
MSELSALSLPPVLLSPTGAASAQELSKRADIRRTAQEFEASFLSIMLQEMFQEVDVSAPFGGGQGEEMFKSFLSDAMAKQMVKAGGVGLTDTVAKEMLKLQGLEE